MGYKVAVIGATGNVGREMLNILAERAFPADEVIPLASRRSMGVEVSFGDNRLKCRDLENFDFHGVDFALMSAGSAIAKEWAPRIGAQGCVVIDNSSCWRYDPDVPLIVPEVNADAVAGFTKKNIIANPNCSTAQLVVVLKPLHDAAKIKRVVVATYQSVSGAGKEAMDELWNQTKGIFVTQLSAEEAREVLREAPGVLVVDKREPGGYVTPVECVGDYATFVSRIRDDQTVDNGLSLWCVSDNLRKGAALNTVQIAELIVNRNLLKKAA
jgi:aspartate-semialdehyde dehydrogenase